MIHKIIFITGNCNIFELLYYVTIIVLGLILYQYIIFNTYGNYKDNICLNHMDFINKYLFCGILNCRIFVYAFILLLNIYLTYLLFEICNNSIIESLKYIKNQASNEQCPHKIDRGCNFIDECLLNDNENNFSNNINKEQHKSDKSDKSDIIKTIFDNIKQKMKKEVREKVEETVKTKVEEQVEEQVKGGKTDFKNILTKGMGFLNNMGFDGLNDLDDLGGLGGLDGLGGLGDLGGLDGLIGDNKDLINNIKNLFHI